MADEKKNKIRRPGAVRRPGMGRQTNPFIDRTRMIDRAEEEHRAEQERRSGGRLNGDDASYTTGIHTGFSSRAQSSDTGIRRVSPRYTEKIENDVEDFGDTEIHRVQFGGGDAAETHAVRRDNSEFVPREDVTVLHIREGAPAQAAGNANRETRPADVSGTENDVSEGGAGSGLLKKKRSKKSKSVLKQQKVTVDEYKFHKKMKRRRRRMVLVLLIVLLTVGLTIAAGYTVYTFVVDHFDNEVSEDSIIIDIYSEQKFRVEKGETTKSLSQRLHKAGLIKDERIFRFLSKFYGYDGQYNAGTYTLSGGLSYEDIMYILSGTPETVRVTFPEGFTTEQIANRLENNNVCTAEEFLKAVDTADVSSYEFLKGTDLSGRDHRLDGYLFPDTYEFDVMAKPEDVIYKMLNRFNEIFRPAYYEQLEKTGLTLDQVVILASIVEKEAKLDSDRAPIAGVFYNRYMYGGEELKMFQSDATVRYAYRRATGKELDHNLSEELELDDPYNTYVYPGFTPGPICSPGEASLIGAIFPSNHTYYYFVARVDGSGGNIYSHTYEEHLQAIKDIANYVPPEDNPGDEDPDD